MRPISIIQFIIWYFFAEANAQERALIFNYKTISLISLPTDFLNVDLRYRFWASVCPAKEPVENEFNLKYSVYNNALFLQQVCVFNQSKEDLTKAVCDDSHKISLTFSANTKKYELGYEIFYDESRLYSPHPPPLENYLPIKYAGKSSSIPAFFNKPENVDGEIAKRKNLKLKLHEKDMQLLWMPLVRIKMSSEQFVNVEYEIRRNNINPALPCDHYGLGNEIRSFADVNLLYSKETQEEIFKAVTLPTRTNETDEDPEGACDPNYECLTKWPLLPTDQFRFGTDSPLICSNITTVPLWKSTLKGIMEKLDKYLYVLYRMSGQPLRVLAGVAQLLELRQGWSKRNITLKSTKGNGEIQTSKLIYKMVTFKLNPCEEDEDEKCWFGILIVIHNGPYINKNDLICDDQSEALGWEEISYETWSNEGAHSKFIYVCQISIETTKRVGLTDIKNTTFRPLSLFKFPLLNKDKKHVLTPIKKKVFDEMKRLSEPGAKVELDGVIERLSIDDNFRSTAGEDFIYKDDENESKNVITEPNQSE